MQNRPLGGRLRPPNVLLKQNTSKISRVLFLSCSLSLTILWMCSFANSVHAQGERLEYARAGGRPQEFPPPPPLRILTAQERQALELMHRKSHPLTDFAGEQMTELQGGRTSKQRVRGDMQGRIRIDYIEPKSLEGDVMIISPDQFRNYHHATNTLDIALWPSPENDREKRLTGAIRSGRMSIERVGEETIAGRSADIVLITPMKREGRFAGGQFKYWLDTQTGIQLKNEISNASGMVSRTFITSIVVGPSSGITRKDFYERFPGCKVNPLFPRNEPKFHNLAEAAGHLPFIPVIPAAIPSEYQISGIWVMGAHRDQGHEKESILLRYSDNVTNFTLYERHSRPDQKNRPRRVPQPGSNRNIERWSVDSPVGPLDVIYIGHLSAEQVEAMSKSLR